MTLAPVAPHDAPAKKKWTILVYSASDNNLQQDQIGNINDIETVGSDNDTNLVAQVDTGAACNRYYLQKIDKPTAGTIGSPSLGDIGPVDMADPKTLSDFIQWGVKNYPAEHYMIIMADHGNGWQGALEDDSANDFGTVPRLRQGLEDAQAKTGVKMDIVGFDACLMASAEVADELKNVANYLDVSQETEGSAGWPYSHILTPGTLKNLHEMNQRRVNCTPQELATQVVKDAAGTQDVLPTMTAVDTSQVPNLTQSIDTLGKALVATGTPGSALADIVSNTQAFTDYKDAYDFASRLATSDKTDAAVKQAAQGVMDAVGKAVIAEQHSSTYPGAHGLTLEISTDGLRDGYTDLQFAKDTQWPAALQALAKDAPQSPPDGGTRVPPLDMPLHNNLMQMVMRDQAARAEILCHPNDAKAQQGVVNVDRQNGTNLKSYVLQHGWPTIHQAGADGAHAAWLLAQHQDSDPWFQHKALGLMENAVAHGEASKADLAYLIDRTRVNDHMPQLFGTQCRLDANGHATPAPIECPETVDQRRKEMGLTQSEADYLKLVEQEYKQPHCSTK